MNNLGEPKSSSRILCCIIFLSVITVVITAIFINNSTKHDEIYKIYFNESISHLETQYYVANSAIRMYNDRANTSLSLDHVVSLKLIYIRRDWYRYREYKVVFVAYDEENEATPGHTYKVNLWLGLRKSGSIISFTKSCFYLFFCSSSVFRDDYDDDL